MSFRSSRHLEKVSEKVSDPRALSPSLTSNLKLSDKSDTPLTIGKVSDRPLSLGGRLSADKSDIPVSDVSDLSDSVSMTLTRRLERLDRIHETIMAVYPRRCPSCGSRDIAPLFWPDASLDVWACSDPDCHAVISGRGD